MCVPCSLHENCACACALLCVSTRPALPNPNRPDRFVWVCVSVCNVCICVLFRSDLTPFCSIRHCVAHTMQADGSCFLRAVHPLVFARSTTMCLFSACILPPRAQQCQHPLLSIITCSHAMHACTQSSLFGPHWHSFVCCMHDVTYMCIHLSTCVFVCVCTCLPTLITACMHACLCVCVSHSECSLCICVCMHVHVCAWHCMHVRACMYVCVCVHVRVCTKLCVRV